MNQQEMKHKYAGQRVQLMGLTGNSNGSTGKVWRITNRGVWVTLPDGRREQWHPNDIRVITR